MEIRWHVAHGYVTGDCPHYTTVDDEDLFGQSQQDVEDIITETVEEDYNQVAYPEIDEIEYKGETFESLCDLLDAINFEEEHEQEDED